MAEFIFPILAAFRMFLHSSGDTALEVLALEHEVEVLERKRRRLPLNSLDRFLWTTLCRVWSRWAEVLVVVKPKTVVGRHRASFRLY